MTERVIRNKLGRKRLPRLSRKDKASQPRGGRKPFPVKEAPVDTRFV